MSVERAIVSRRGSSRLVYTRRLLPDPAFHSVRTLSLSFPCAVCLVLATGKGPCWRWSSLWWILDALVHSGAGATNREAGERIRERVVLNADGQSAANPPIRDDGPANSLALVYAAQELFGCVWNKENWYWRERREKNHALGYDSRAMSNDAPGCESLAWWFPSLSRRWLISSERRDAFLNTQMTCQTLYIQSALLPSRPSIFFNSICLVSPLMLTACAPTPTVCCCCWRKTSSPLTAEMYIYIFRAYYYCWICVSPLSDIPRPADTPLVISVVHLSLQFSLCPLSMMQQWLAMESATQHTTCHSFRFPRCIQGGRNVRPRSDIRRTCSTEALIE